MISVLKSTTRRHAREKARSSSSTAAATAAVGTGVVKNSSASNSNNSSNHIQNTGDDAAFGGLNHLTGSYEKVGNDRKPAALQKQQPNTAKAAMVSIVDRKITSTLSSDSDNNPQPEKAGDNQSPQTAVAAVATAAAAAAAASVAAAAAVAEPSSEGGQQPPRSENIPKFVRVGQKVCFSTVVAAVLIPSSEDISEASKRELWWQATDYAEFRLNYAMRMQDPSLKKDYDYANYTSINNDDENCYGYDNGDAYSGGGDGLLQGNENTVPYAVASVNEHSAPATAGYHYGNGGGMMCASPHVMAGRAQHAPTATVEGVLVVAAAPAPAVLASRPYPSNELCHAGMGLGGKHDGGMLKGNSGCPIASTGQGRATKSSRHQRAARPRSNISPDEQQQKLASRRRVVNDRPAPARYGGRRDGWNEPEYAMPRGSNFQHGGGVGGGGQFFVNGYTAGVYDPPPPRAAYGNNAQYGHGAAMAEAYLPVQQHHQRHHHAHGGTGGMTGGVGVSGGGASYVRSSGGLGAPSVVMVQAPSSSQFSMWRSQLVFSPVMMQ